jgi:hypothetical protein
MPLLVPQMSSQPSLNVLEANNGLQMAGNYHGSTGDHDHHVQYGIASTVARTTCFAYGKWQKSTPRNLKPLNQSTPKSARMIMLERMIMINL